MAKEVTPAGVVLDRIIDIYSAVRSEFGEAAAVHCFPLALSLVINDEGAVAVLTCAVARLAEPEVTR